MGSGLPTTTWPSRFIEAGISAGFRRHLDYSRKYAQRAGLKVCDDGEVAVHVGTPQWWSPIEGKKNVLYTAWEVHEVPDVTREALARADAVIVTAPFMLGVFRRAVPRMPMRCVPLGVDVTEFPYVKRGDPYKAGGQFRFMWCGANSERKGVKLVTIAWKRFRTMWDLTAPADLRARVEPMMYVKTNYPKPLPGHEDLTGIEAAPADPALILDSRRLPLRSLSALYQWCHCFVFPSMGEGFGQTQFEACATGMPAIYTPSTALGDFFSAKTGYPVEWAWTDQQYDRGPVRMAQANTADVALKMQHVLVNYREALRKGKRASQMVRRDFTWERCGRGVVEALRAWRKEGVI